MKYKNFNYYNFYLMFLLECSIAFLTGYSIFRLFDDGTFSSIFIAIIMYLSNFYLYYMIKELYSLNIKMELLYGKR